jgi:hypothetical protein
MREVLIDDPLIGVMVGSYQIERCGPSMARRTGAGVRIKDDCR